MNIHAQDIQEFTVDLSEREIYNDIRAECDLVDILELHPDATPEFMEEYTMDVTHDIPPDSQQLYIFRAPAEHAAPYFLGAEITYVHSDTTGSVAGIIMGDPNFNSTRSEMWVYVSNRWGTPARPDEHTFTVTVTGHYTALDPGERYVRLRSVDETSVLKYGRRVMNLVWPMGQHPTYMQRIIDRYLERHSEPVCVANMLLVGKSDEIAQNILELDINDRVTITHPVLNIPREEEGDYEYEGFETEWFVNSIDCVHSVGGVLEGYFDLEQVRIMERYPDSHEPVDRYEYEYEGG